MFDLNDDEFCLDDLIELDIEYGLFDEDNQTSRKKKKVTKQKIKSIWDLFRS